jgi:Mn2+/Fe2+ NRAMP family transporter
VPQTCHLLQGRAAFGYTLGWSVVLTLPFMVAVQECASGTGNRLWSGGVDATIAGATLIGTALSLSPLDPVKALFWSAVINGVVAAPLIVAMTVMGSLHSVMGSLVLPFWLRALGWLSAMLMGAATVRMLVV